MSNLQKTLKDLQPHLMGIRYLQGIPILEVALKDGWFMPQVNRIQKAEVEGGQNHYLIYGDDENVEIDFLIEYLMSTIKINVEREIKLELLKQKINSLKDLFKENSLAKLRTLKFSFGENIEEEEFDLKTIDLIPEPLKKEQPRQQIIQPPLQEIIPQPEVVIPEVIDNPDNLSEDELEILMEEKRYEQYKKMKENNLKKLPKAKVKVELPPKKTMMNIIGGEYDDELCECGPNEACDKCIDSKTQ